MLKKNLSKNFREFLSKYKQNVYLIDYIDLIFLALLLNTIFTFIKSWPNFFKNLMQVLSTLDTLTAPNQSFIQLTNITV